jgi:hypothetical protein
MEVIVNTFEKSGKVTAEKILSGSVTKNLGPRIYS